ncbi:NACHT domain-containing protein [Actinomadura logoneensis]|uniref:NACHT domain-containing protein n=1 Tax=Actinomadura logoneensis TaxID=2293572 RepID=A0A372JAX4_9ACTN|nr:NACHT domain-containing protein [Actinomadura logoneensis]RFU37165.1 NACHT domain-containing protein [Actinomadura logoneensis]
MTERYTNNVTGSPRIVVQTGKHEGPLNITVPSADDVGLPPDRPAVPALVASVLLGGLGAFLAMLPGWAGLLGVLLVVAGLQLAGSGAYWIWRSRRARTAVAEDRLTARAEALRDSVRGLYEAELEQAGADARSAIAVRWSVPDGVRQAAGAGDFLRDGAFSQAAELIQSVGSRRLVVLGGPGAGKSVFATALAARFADAEPDGPVPVVVPLAGWVPARERLLAWAARRVAAAHPELGRSVADARLVASGLLRARRVLLVLDGLDEIPAKARATALEELNRPGSARLPMVLTSRPQEYADAVRDAGVLPADAAVVELRPLVTGQITASLPLADASPDPDARWRPVLAALEADEAGPLAEALASPLMVGLARAAYARASDDPAELLGLRDAAAVENRLLERFVPAAYADRDETGRAEARRWVGFLAWHLRENDENDLEWWRLDEAVPAAVRALGPASALVAAGAAVWALGYRIPHRFWVARDVAPHAESVAAWALFPILAYLGIVTWSQVAREGWLMPPQRLRAPREVRHALRRRRLEKQESGAAGNAPGGAGPGRFFAMPGVAVLLTALGIWLDGPLGRFVAASLVLAGVIVLGRFAWWFSVASEPAEESGPPGMLRADRRAALALGWDHVLGQAWPLPLLLGTPFLLALRWEDRLEPAPLVLAFVLTLAVLWFGGITLSAWGRFRVAHAWLTLRGRTPHDLMAFLEDARRRGVLRRSGGGYRFRHGALRDRMAERYVAETGRAPRPPTGPQLLAEWQSMLAMQALCLLMLYLCALPGMDGGHVVGFVRWFRAPPETADRAACEALRREVRALVAVPLEAGGGRSGCAYVEGDPLRPAVRVSLDVASDPGMPDVSQQGQNAPTPNSPPKLASATAREASAGAVLSSQDYTLGIRSEVSDARMGDRALYLLDRALRASSHYEPRTFPWPGPLPPPSDERFRLYDARRPARTVTGPAWTAGDWTRLWALPGLGFAFRGPVFEQCVRSGERWYCVRPEDRPDGRRTGPFQLEVGQRPCSGPCPPPAGAGWRRSDASTWYAERWDGHAYTLDVHAVRAGKSLEVRVATTDTRADVARKTVNDISAQAAR